MQIQFSLQKFAYPNKESPCQKNVLGFSAPVFISDALAQETERGRVYEFVPDLSQIRCL